VKNDLFPFDGKPHRTGQNLTDLFIVVAVLRNGAPLLHQYARHHDFVSHHKLAVKQRIDGFNGQFTPTNMLAHQRTIISRNN